MASHKTLVLSSLFALSGCASLPDAPLERGLYVDVRKAVEREDDVGWVPDRLDV